MPSQTPARDFVLPRLHALLQDAAREGIGRDVAVAVLIDLVTGPGFNDTPLDPADDTEPARDAALATSLDLSAERIETERHQVPGNRGALADGNYRNNRRGWIGLSDI